VELGAAVRSDVERGGGGDVGVAAADPERVRNMSLANRRADAGAPSSQTATPPVVAAAAATPRPPRGAACVARPQWGQGRPPPRCVAPPTHL